MCAVKHNLDAHVSSPKIWKVGLMLVVSVKMGNSLLRSFLKFSRMFYNLSPTSMSQFNYNDEIFMPDRWKWGERNSYELLKWTGNWLLGWVGSVWTNAWVTVGIMYKDNMLYVVDIKIIWMNKFLFCLQQNVPLKITSVQAGYTHCFPPTQHHNSLLRPGK
jgi:hypothetical protein